MLLITDQKIKFFRILNIGNSSSADCNFFLSIIMKPKVLEFQTGMF